MPHNMIILYFRLPYFQVSNNALLNTLNCITLILHRRNLDTFRMSLYMHVRLVKIMVFRN